MKKIVCVLAILVLMATMASATLDVEVDCDSPGWWNTPVCRDWELQDEFDTVSDYVNDNENIWAKDEVGGGGISSGRAREIANETMIPYLTELTEKVQELELRIEVLETYIEEQDKQGFWDSVVCVMDKYGLKSMIVKGMQYIKNPL